MKWIICLFKGHVWMRNFRLAVLDDSWPANYTAKSHACNRCKAQREFES